MAHLKPSFVLDLETRVQRNMVEEYQRLTQDTWWQKLCKKQAGNSQKEIRWWLLSTAEIQTVDKDGSQVEFNELQTMQDSFEQQAHTTGLKIPVREFTDLDGNGLNLAAEWSSQVAQYAAYWPQKMIADAILANGDAYDGQPFFDTAHPFNPTDSSLGTYSNDVVCDIVASGNVATALSNMYALRTAIAGWRMPNGKTPKRLKLGDMFVPPALEHAALLLTGSEQVAGTVGQQDVRALKGKLGLGQPVVCDELGAGVTGNAADDEYFYIGVQNMMSDELAAMVYSEVDPFTTTMVTGTTDAELQIANALQWVTRGRNTVAYGHPYNLIRCRLTA